MACAAPKGMKFAAPKDKEFGLSKAVLNKYTPATWTAKSFVSEPQLIDLTASCQEYKDVMSKIKATMPTISISRIQRVQNSYLWGAYLLKKAENANLQEMKLFHATAQSNISSIVSNNYDWRRTVRSKFGKGVSFSPSAAYADKYCNKTVGIQRAMILNRVLVGKTLSGSQFTEVPAKKYDTTTGNNGKVYVKYGDNEFYPEYVAYYANSSNSCRSGARGNRSNDHGHYDFNDLSYVLDDYERQYAYEDLMFDDYDVGNQYSYEDLMFDDYDVDNLCDYDVMFD